MGEVGGEIIGAAIGSVTKTTAPVVAEASNSIAKAGVEIATTAKPAEILTKTTTEAVKEVSSVNPSINFPSEKKAVQGEEKTSGAVGSAESWARFGAGINKQNAEEEERKRQERKRTEELVKIRKLLQQQKAA